MNKRTPQDVSRHLERYLFSQVGTSTWRRHLLTISNLVDDETKRRYLSKPSNITNNEFYKLMLFQQQLQNDFDVEDFSHNMGLLSFSFVRHPFERYVQGDTSRWFKPTIDIKTKVTYWPGLPWPGQAKTELLFSYQQEVWLTPMCHPVHTFLVFTGFSGISDSTFCWLQKTKLCIREELQVAPLVAF